MVLGQERLATAMIDISDGLSDLNHICRESRVGALIHSSLFPSMSRLLNFADAALIHCNSRFMAVRFRIAVYSATGRSRKIAKARRWSWDHTLAKFEMHPKE